MRICTSLLFGAGVLLAACTPERQAASNAENVSDLSDEGATTAGDGAPLSDVNQLQLAAAAPTQDAGCPVKSVKWIAFVQPVNGQRKLVVAGWVRVNSSGWTLELRPAAPSITRPVTQVFDLDATPPSGPVILPTPIRQVHAVIDAQQEYLAVVMKCGGEEIARITEIPEKDEYRTGPADVQSEEGNRS